MPKFVERISAQKFSSAASTALDVFVSGDSNARVAVDAGGKITWGAGDGAGDTTLYRSAANTLKTDDVFQAAAGVVTLATAGTPTSSLASGGIAVDTTNNKLYFKSSGSWRLVEGVSTTVVDGGTASAAVRYHVNADGGINGASA